MVIEDAVFTGLSDGCTGPIDDGATVVRGWSEAAEPEGLQVRCANNVSSITDASSDHIPHSFCIGHRTHGVEGKVEGKVRSQGLEVLTATKNRVRAKTTHGSRLLLYLLYCIVAMKNCAPVNRSWTRS